MEGESIVLEEQDLTNNLAFDEEVASPTLTSMITASNATTDYGRSEPGLLAAFSALLQVYGYVWLRFVVTAVIVAAIANGIFGIPLWQIVDVNLSVFLFFVGLYVAWNIARLLADILRRDLASAIAHLILIPMLALLPFGVIAGYMIYGVLGGGEVAGASFVYDGFVNMFAQGYKQLAGVVGDFFGAIKEVKTSKGLTPTVDLATLAQAAGIVGGLATAVGVWLRWQERRERLART